MTESKAGTFNAYLEYAQRGGSGTPSAPSAPSVPASLLGLLNKEFPAAQGAPMGDLAERSGMSASGFRDALKKLVDAGFIEISGQSLSEVVTLTAKGLDTAALL